MSVRTDRYEQTDIDEDQVDLKINIGIPDFYLA